MVKGDNALAFVAHAFSSGGKGRRTWKPRPAWDVLQVLKYRRMKLGEMEIESQDIDAL